MSRSDTLGVRWRLAVAASALILLWPPTASANAIIPLTAVFNPRTWAQSLVATVVIVVIEAIVIRAFLRMLTWKGALWRSALANLTSSAIGSFIFMTDGPTPPGTGVGFVVLVGVISFAIETPILWWTLPRRHVTAGRVVGIEIVSNATSNVALLVLQAAAFYLWFFLASRGDRADAREWNRPDMLAQSSGAVYGMDRHRLRAFDVKVQQWRELPDCSQDNFLPWDVVGDTGVVMPRAEGDGNHSTIRIVRMPGCKPVVEVDIARLIEAPARKLQVADLKLAPDGRVIAALVQFGEVLAPRDSGSTYTLGRKCRLILLDAATGELIHTARRWAIHYGGVGWLPNGRGVLFLSLHDESLYERGPEDGKTSYGHGIDEQGPFAAGLYELEPRSGEIRRFAKGSGPVPNLARSTVMVKRGDAIEELDLQGRTLRSVSVDRLEDGLLAVSPDGRFVVLGLRMQTPMQPRGMPVVVNFEEPSQRHILQSLGTSDIAWTTQ